MRYVSAYLLAVLGGNQSPKEEDIRKILSSVGVEVDPVCLKKVVDQLKGKNIEQLIEEGRKKLATMPSGGGGATAPAAAAAAPAAEAEKAKAEATKAKPKEKTPEPDSEDEDMGFGLFD